MARKKKKSTPEQRLAKLNRHQGAGFKLAKKAAKVFKKLRDGGKLTKGEAKTLSKLRTYKKKHEKARRKAMTPEQRKGIKKAKRTYTAAKRKRAAAIAWVTRRSKYGKQGRADASSFQKAAATRKKNIGKKGSKKGSKKSGSKKSGKKSSTSKKIKDFFADIIR